MVATWDVAGDTAFGDSGLVAALVLEKGDSTPPAIARDSATRPAGTLVAEAAWQPRILALELRSPAHHAAGRGRARPPAGSEGPSGLLLFDPEGGDTLPASFPAALARIHVGPVRIGARVGLYWEVYGVSPGSDLATSVSVAPEKEGLLHRLAAAVGLAARRGRVLQEWHEAAQPGHGTESRALVVDLAGLAAGPYRFEVTVSVGGGKPATSSRTVTIVRP